MLRASDDRRYLQETMYPIIKRWLLLLAGNEDEEVHYSIRIYSN